MNERNKSTDKDFILLERNYKLLSDLMDYIPDVIYFKDKDGKLIMVNEAHAKGLGLRPEEVIGKTDFDIFGPPAKDMVKDDEFVMSTGKAIIDKIERSTRADGLDNFVSTTKIPRRDKDGNIIGVLGITRDITHRMQLESLTKENELTAERLETAEAINKEKSDLVLEICHDLKTPILSAQKALEILEADENEPLTERQKKALNLAKSSFNHLTKITENCFDIYKIENNRFSLHNSLVNISELITSRLIYFQKWADEKNITITCEVPEHPVNLFIDAEKIDQVIANLINNAIKFTDSKGNIGISLKVLESKIRIAITDTGIGIPEEFIPHLFNMNKFIELSRPNEPQRLEVGLGLSIAQKIVTQHDGGLWAESKRGEGSTFYFTLPILNSVNILNRKLRYKLNTLLNKYENIYLLNILILNFKEFKKRIKVDALKVFNDINALVYKITNDFKSTNNIDCKILLQDYSFGEWTIVMPKTAKKDAVHLCQTINKAILNYFQINTIENIFMNTGLKQFPQQVNIPIMKKTVSNLQINPASAKISKDRLATTNIDLFFSGVKTDISQILHISETSIQFMTQKQFKTDSEVQLKLTLSQNKTVEITGIVRWITNIKEVTSGLYQVGMELKYANNVDKQVVEDFVKEIILY